MIELRRSSGHMSQLLRQGEFENYVLPWLIGVPLSLIIIHIFSINSLSF